MVAPPSRNRQGPYTWYAACEMQSMPPALLQKLKEPGAAYSGSSTIQSRKGEEQEKSIYVSPQPAPQPAAADLPPSDAPASPAASPARAHAASADLAIEARNEYLIRKAGALRADGFSAHEIYGMLLALNERRYGAGRHPHGPLSLDELERTIFKSVARWEQENSGLIVPTSAQIRSINDLLSMDLPPVNWIVPGLLSEGATLLAGKPKVGKSWLILGLAITCAQGSVQGQSVLGRYPVEPMGVLYLSLEDSPARLRSRVMKMLNGKSLPASFGYALNWKPLQAGGLQNLEEYLLTAPDTRLVIIDTLAKVRQATSGNGSTYQEDSLLMAQLQQLANAHHIALVIIHHVRKMGSEDVFDEVSGTLGLTGSADTTIVLKRPRYQNEGSLNITGRDVEEQELTLAFTPATGFWRITDSPASEQRPLNASRQAIIELLKEKGAMTPIEIAKELARPASSIRSLLSKMAGENILRKQRYGSYALLNADQTAFGEEGFFEEDTDF